MNLLFNGQTNAPVCHVWSADFTTKDGHTVTVNRDETNFIAGHGKLEMEWMHPYVEAFDGKSVPRNQYLIEEVLDGASFDGITLDDDPQVDIATLGNLYKVWDIHAAIKDDGDIRNIPDTHGITYELDEGEIER